MGAFAIYEVNKLWRGYLYNTNKFFTFPGATTAEQLQAAQDFVASLDGGVSTTMKWIADNLNDPFDLGGWDNFYVMRTYNILFTADGMDVGTMVGFDVAAWAAANGKTYTTLADCLTDSDASTALSTAVEALLA